VTSDAINRQPLARPRVLAKWGILGFFDGFFTGMWYRHLEVSFGALDPLSKCLAMFATSSLLYTPAYAAGFVVVGAALDGLSPKEIGAKFRRDIRPLTTASITTWGPLNLILFGVVPIHMRVVVSMAWHYIYLVFVAMWDSGYLGQFIENSRAKLRMSLNLKISPPTAGEVAAAAAATAATASATAVATAAAAAAAPATADLFDILGTDAISPGTIVAAAAAASAATTLSISNASTAAFQPTAATHSTAGDAS